MRMLFVDYSSVFHTVILSKLTSNLHEQCVISSLCNCILNFLSDCPQAERLVPQLFSTITEYWHTTMMHIEPHPLLPLHT